MSTDLAPMAEFRSHPLADPAGQALTFLYDAINPKSRCFRNGFKIFFLSKSLSVL